MPYAPTKPLGSDNHPTLAAGTTVSVPDGYYAGGSPRPWVLCTVVEQRGSMLTLTNPDGRQISAPAYSVRIEQREGRRT